MTEESAFLRAVCDAPGDDLPRLVYADYLDERGDPRGEFIRVQCELDSLDRTGPCPTCGRLCGERYEPDCRWMILSCLESQLLAAHGFAWAVASLPGMRPTAVESRGFIDPGFCGYQFRRGFVESITCPARTFLEHCHDIRNACPLREATLAGDVDPDWFPGSVMREAGRQGERVRLCEGKSELGIVEQVYHAHRGDRRSEWGRKLFLDLLHAEFRGVSFRLAESVTVLDRQVRGGSVFPVREPRAFITGST